MADASAADTGDVARRLHQVAKLIASPVEGERQAALEAADRLLLRLGTSWQALAIEAATRAASSTPTKPDPAPGGTHVGTVAQILVRAEGELTAWEEKFLRGVLVCKKLSDKQRHQLDNLARRYLA